MVAFFPLYMHRLCFLIWCERWIQRVNWYVASWVTMILSSVSSSLFIPHTLYPKSVVNSLILARVHGCSNLLDPSHVLILVWRICVVKLVNIYASLPFATYCSCQIIIACNRMGNTDTFDYGYKIL